MLGKRAMSRLATCMRILGRNTMRPFESRDRHFVSRPDLRTSPPFTPTPSFPPTLVTQTLELIMCKIGIYIRF